MCLPPAAGTCSGGKQLGVCPLSPGSVACVTSGRMSQDLLSLRSATPFTEWLSWAVPSCSLLLFVMQDKV